MSFYICFSFYFYCIPIQWIYMESANVKYKKILFYKKIYIFFSVNFFMTNKKNNKNAWMFSIVRTAEN